MAPLSRIKHSTTEPLRSLSLFGILLNTKTLSIKHDYTMKTVLFLTCKRHYNNHISCYQDSTFASNAKLSNNLFFSEWLIRRSWKSKDVINRCCINFALPIMQLKHVFDPLLFKVMNDAVEIQLKYTNCFPQTYHISQHHFSRYFISLSHLLK